VSIFDYILIIKIPENLVFGTWYYLSFYNAFFESSAWYQVLLERIFQNILRYKNKVFEPVHIHIEPRRGTLKRFKNGGKCLLNFSK